MSRRVLALVLALLALAGGCGEANDGRQDARLTPADLGWLERFGNWTSRYYQASVRAGQTNVALLGGSATAADLERSLRPIRECRQSFERSVGRATPSRFEAVEPLVHKACEQLRLGAERLVRSFDDPATHAYASEEHFSKATSIFLDVDAAIERRLYANRPLPASERPGESRIHPRLNRVASHFAGRGIEVRCWSVGEWPAIRREANAYGDNNIDFVGMADPLRDRIHLAPTICDGLAKLLDANASKRRLAPDEDLAEAVETLAHEIEHVLAPGTERRVECAAIQRTAEVAQALGAGRALARNLARLYWSEVYPTMPDRYRSRHCRSGGEFDLHPESVAWPTP